MKQMKSILTLLLAAMMILGAVPVFADIDAAECPTMETDGAVYKLLTLEQYLKVYSSSSADSYRHRDETDKDNADQIKVKIIQKALNRAV